MDSPCPRRYVDRQVGREGDRERQRQTGSQAGSRHSRRRDVGTPFDVWNGHGQQLHVESGPPHHQKHVSDCALAQTSTASPPRYKYLSLARWHALHVLVARTHLSVLSSHVGNLVGILAHVHGAASLLGRCTQHPISRMSACMRPTQSHRRRAPIQITLSLSHIHKQTDTHVVARCTSQTAVGSPHERLRVSARTHDGQSTRLCRRAYTLHVPKHTPTLPPDSSPRHHPRPHTLLSSVVCVAPCAPTNHALTNTPTPAHNLECAQHLQYNSNSGEMRDVLCGEGGVCPTV